ncbi:MAG: protein translocase subunit SecD [Dehalococcoidia bacterium]|nr:protein translocase subunit SecD [Dehalococcoidia bacterium]
MKIFRRPLTWSFIFVLVIASLAAYLVAAKTFHVGNWDRGDTDTFLGLRLGLDLKGGTHLVYQAQPPEGRQLTDQDIAGVIESIQRRVNGFGVTEPIIQRLGTDRVLVQLPGVKDVEAAKSLIGKQAVLDFRQLDPATNPNNGASWIPATARDDQGETVHLNGSYLTKATLGTNQSTGLPVVLFEFNGEGGRMFGQITTRLRGQPLGIFLDGQLISSPTVQAVITNQGEITGVTATQAQQLSIQLNAGALPVPITIVQEQTVDATLGKDSLDKSIIAGAVGLSLVLLFMIMNYKLPGVIAGASLVIYAVIALAVFKTVPVTLTLAGIAAFILSIGMAIDANILIFERTKEEIRTGKPILLAMEAGFDRAWPSIRDSNFATILISAILFWFGQRLGESVITGFALTLFIGVIISMLTAIFITRTFLRVLLYSRLARNTALFRA